LGIYSQEKVKIGKEDRQPAQRFITSPFTPHTSNLLSEAKKADAIRLYPRTDLVIPKY
jgi:hypothetical protein